MRFTLRAGALGLVAAGLAYGSVWAAEGTMPSSVSGTMVGDKGGAYVKWDVTLPESKDVTLTLAHWPCNTGPSIGFEVWGKTSKIASSHQADSCTQKAMFNSGAGGAASVRLHNYLHGVGTWYTLTAEGMSLPGAAPMAVASTAASDSGTMAAGTTTGTGTTAATGTTTGTGAAAAGTTTGTGTTAATGTTADAGTMAAPSTATGDGAATMAGDSLSMKDQTLLGNSGGAANRYDVMVKEGQTYTAKLHYGTDMGGTWPAIGFKVWGPNGWVASSHATGTNDAEATFTATGNVKYTVEVYNYHHGVTAFYGIDVMGAAASTN